MNSWLTKIREKLAVLVGPKGNIDWLTWMTIWESINRKEGLAHPPWVEFQMGMDVKGRYFEKISFGQLDNLKPTLGKIILEYYPSPIKELHLFKNNLEICSTDGEQIGKFWSDLRKTTYANIQTTISPYLTVSRLKIADDVMVAQEQKILQWIKTSILSLKNALNRVHGSKDEFVTARLLLGKLPLQESLHVIIHCFNMEIVLLSTEAKAWKLLAYDHKDGDGVTKSAKPSLNSLVEVQLSNIWLELDQLAKNILKI